MSSSTHVAHAVEVIRAGRTLARHGLVTAFGHVSARSAPGSLVITAPVPLGTLALDDVRVLEVSAEVLPPDTPREAWMHCRIAAARTDVGAVCRAQPPTATALVSAGVPVLPLHGLGSFVGPRVPVHPDSRLVRDADAADALVASLGDEHAVILRGNGAVTVGATVAEAVARMWVLEASALLNATAAAAGTPVPLPDDEQAAWRAVAAELLPRIWTWLSAEETP